MDPTELNNQEDIYGQPGGEQQSEQQPTMDTAPVAEQPEAAAEPEDLASYFRSLHKNDNEPAQDNVASGEGSAEQQPAGTDVQYQQTAGSGTDAVDLTGFDARAKIEETYNGIRQAVLNKKRSEWEEKGYHKFSIRDLARKDERTGKIFYVNPNDDPGDWERPGYQGIEIDKAKTWVDIMNQDLNDQWKKECSELEKQMLKEAMPYFQMIAYADTYAKLSPTEREFVNEMTDPYAIRGSDGTVLGFNCDLNSITALAKRMASKFGGNVQQQPQAQVNNVRQPVVDARSSAGGSARQTTNVNDITNLQDAMRVVIAEDRARKAGK